MPQTGILEERAVIVAAVGVAPSDVDQVVAGVAETNRVVPLGGAAQILTEHLDHHSVDHAGGDCRRRRRRRVVLRRLARRVGHHHYGVGVVVGREVEPRHGRDLRPVRVDRPSRALPGCQVAAVPPRGPEGVGSSCFAWFEPQIGILALACLADHVDLEAHLAGSRRELSDRRALASVPVAAVPITRSPRVADWPMFSSLGLKPQIGAYSWSPPSGLQAPRSTISPLLFPTRMAETYLS